MRLALRSIVIMMLPVLWATSLAEENTEQSIQRLVVLTDITADPDDEQSLVRLLLYANEIDIEGIVATTSVHKKSDPATAVVQKVIEAYGRDHENLLLHDEKYPTKEDLLDLVKEGSAVYGMNGVGDRQDTEGSDWILRVLEKDDERPVWVSVWGGVNTLAQALYKMRETYSDAEAERLLQKLRVYTISDQDDSGPWIRREFPELFYIVTPGGDYPAYLRSTWIAFTRSFPGFSDFISNSWIADNIQQGHGALGAAYPDITWGHEGDTPSYLALIPNGLSVPDRPDWGGWGGRYELYLPEFVESAPNPQFPSQIEVPAETRPIWTNAVDSYTPWVAQEFARSIGPAEESYKSNQVTLLRWRDDIQRDFAARMDWTVKSFEEANHPPVARLQHVQELTAESGQMLFLDASASFDPDGDSLSYHWFNYAEAGTLDSPVEMGHAVNYSSVRVQLPEVDSSQTLHFIVRVTDKGEPALSRYARVVVTLEPSR